MENAAISKKSRLYMATFSDIGDQFAGLSIFGLRRLFQ